MEGLLPMIYKAIRKNKTRRKYECLSSGAAMSYSINMADMICDRGYQNHSTRIVANDCEDKIGHRRYKSVGDFSSGFSSSQPRTFADASPASKQLVRVRSHSIFSCITGV